MSGMTSEAVALPPRNPWRSVRITCAPALAAPRAAPSPAGPPPPTSTSHSPASVATRGGRGIVAATRGRGSGGMARSAALRRRRRGCPARPAGGEEVQRDLVGPPGARLNGRQRALEARLQVAPQVPPAVDVRDELTRVDVLERRHADFEVL